MKRKAQANDRKVAPSFKGRLKFMPGDDHPLDVMITEAQQLWEHLLVNLDQVAGTLDQVIGVGDPVSRLSAEDQAIQQVLRRRYGEHKHRDHILATFIALYRKRLLLRLQAAQEALELARELLTPEDTFLKDLQRALQIDPVEAEINRSALVGNAQEVKGRLTDYERRLQSIRKVLTTGNGWFETFYIPKTRLNRRYLELARKKQPIPEGVEPWETVTFGPYLKYRWREGSGPIYTISMGLIPGGDGGLGEDTRREESQT